MIIFHISFEAIDQRQQHKLVSCLGNKIELADISCFRQIKNIHNFAKFAMFLY